MDKDIMSKNGMEVVAGAISRLLLKDHWVCETKGDSIFIGEDFKVTVMYIGQGRDDQVEPCDHSDFEHKTGIFCNQCSEYLGSILPFPMEKENGQ